MAAPAHDSGNDHVWTAGSGNKDSQILKFTLDGKFVLQIGRSGNELRIIERLTNEVLARVGRPGRFAGQFHVVHNIAVDKQGNVYTTEVNTGQRVQKFRRIDPQD